MKLYFKQKLFSWFDSYDVYNEQEEIEFRIKGELSWGHLLKIYDYHNEHVATLKERIMTILPSFEIYKNNEYIGRINKEFTLFKPSFNIDYNGWYIDGNFLEWNYSIYDANDNLVASISKDVFRFTDYYILDINDNYDPLDVLMVVLAIDAEKCSRED